MKLFYPDQLRFLPTRLLTRTTYSSSENRGFTVIELLTIIAIIAIMGLVATPKMSDLMAKERRVAAINRLLSVIQYTRTLAQVRQKTTTLCPTSDEKHCLGNWNQPLMIFVDFNKDRQRQAHEPLLKKVAAISRLDSLRWKAFRNSNVLQFLPSGISNHQNGTFLYCPEKIRSDLARGIIMTKMGRTRLSKDSNHDGFQEGAGGRILACP